MLDTRIAAHHIGLQAKFLTVVGPPDGIVVRACRGPVRSPRR